MISFIPTRKVEIVKPPTLLIVAIAFIITAPCESKVLHVKVDGAGPDGLSWETAFPIVGDAIDAATSGDDIWVAAGRYFEAVTLTSNLSLYGGFQGNEATDEFHLRDWKSNETVLDATNMHSSVIRIAFKEDCIIDGFTITNGNTGHHLALQR